MLYVLLPVYNEEEALPRLLDKIKRTLDGGEAYEVVVVNDGSTDGSLGVVKDYSGSMPLVLLDHGTNKGLGVAMRTGFDYLIGKGGKGDVVVTMDADFSHDPALVPGMVQAVRAGNQVVIASRFVEGGEQVGLPLHRRMLSGGFSVFVRAVGIRYDVKDWTCGYRAYDWEALRGLADRYGNDYITSPGFVVMFEVLFKMLKSGYSAAEVPLVLRYDLKLGRSKIRILRTVFQYFGFLLRELFSGKGRG